MDGFAVGRMCVRCVDIDHFCTKAPWVQRKSGLHRDSARRGLQLQQSYKMNLRYKFIFLFTSYTLIHSHNCLLQPTLPLLHSSPSSIFKLQFDVTTNTSFVHRLCYSIHLLCVSSASLLIFLFEIIHCYQHMSNNIHCIYNLLKLQSAR